jgi:starvation-inducible outer membrane lipoprotein
MLDFISELVSGFIRRVDYSFTNMNMTQWAIFATVCLVVAFIFIKAKVSC